MQLALWFTWWVGLVLLKTTNMAPLSNTCAPMVLVEQGLVRGTCISTLQGDTFYAFKGIPYGKPPIGKLRFQAPQPGEPWNGVYDATEDSKICPQIFSGGKIKYSGDEDCLRLYVYSHPLSRYNRSLPVLVYFHGGAALKGSALYINPRRLMSNQDLPIVLVAVQYRLLSLGLLSTGDEASPGNNMVLDGILALKWIQKNIRQFGGDLNKVTIGGDSAGGIATLMLPLSSAADGLFRAAASFSGSMEFDIFMQDDPFKMAKKFGTMLGCENDNTTALVECLRGKTAAELTIPCQSVSTA